MLGFSLGSFEDARLFGLLAKHVFDFDKLLPFFFQRVFHFVKMLLNIRRLMSGLHFLLEKPLL